MMRAIVKWSLRYRFLVVAMAAGMIFIGSWQLQKTPVDVFPEFAPPRVEIQTPSLGLSASEVEELVTVPLEDGLNGVEGLDVMRSKSVPALSSIVLIFEPGTDLMRARQLVMERLATITPTLPPWSSPPVLMPPLSATSRTLKIGLSSQEVSLIEMSMISYWKIRPRLLRVPGVANVAIWGERLQMLQVQMQPDWMRSHGVTLNQVMETTADALDAGLLQFSDGHLIVTGGFIDTPNQRLGVQYVLPIVSPADLSNLPIKGRPDVRLKDVALLVEDHQPLIGDAIINDGPGLLLIVEKFPWANTLEVTRGVEEALDELKPGLQGIEIDSAIFRPATFIEMSIDNLTNALVIGIILVVAVLLLFLFEWRTALISLIAIPLSLFAASIVLYMRGATINVMVLAGLIIAVGVVVDDAIIDVENIWRRLRQRRSEGSAQSLFSIILDASVEVRSAIIYASLMEAAVLMPVFFLEGLSGAFFRPLALSYIIAMMASMLVAMTVTPALGLILLSRAPLEHRTSPIVPRLQRAYTAVLNRILARPQASYAAVLGIGLTGILILPQLGSSLLPDFKERDFLMHWLTKPGTSHPEMNRITTQASVELRSIPGVQNFGAHIGQALLMDEVVGVDFGENWVSVDQDVDYDGTVDAIQDVVDGYPGLFRDVQTYLKERIREVLTGTDQAIVVRIYGDDLHVLRQEAERVRDAISDVNGLADLHIELHEDIPQVEVKVDLLAAQRYGLKPGDVRRAVGVLIAGEEAGDIFRDGKAYDVQVWSTPQTRNSIESVQNLMLDTPLGTQVRLGDVADVRVAPVPNSIEREYQSRRLDVSAGVSDRDLGSVVDDINQRLETLQFPIGYRAEMLGEAQERSLAQNRLFTYGIASAIGVFILLVASFGSFRLAVLSFVSLPCALVGGVLAAYMGDGVISLGSLVGFLTVLGIAARNGIMMINHFQHLEQFEGETLGPALVLRGARERLAPILMTALTTGLALVPLVIAGNLPGHEIEHPMAVVILGGLVTSTLLNLFIVPPLYLRFARRNKSSQQLQPA
jgi:CzcA family heavy metal efflux pump